MKRSIFVLVALVSASNAFAGLHKATATLKLENTTGHEKAAIQDFVELAKKGPALDEIAARLALTTAWKLEPAAASVRLASVLEVSPNGRDGEITAADESPVMAAIIANTAASVLQTFEGETAPVLLVELEKTIAEQTELVADKRKLLAQIIRQNAIVVDREGAEPEEPVKGDLDSAMYVDALGDFETSQRLLEQLELKRKELKSEKALRVHHVIWARAAEEK